MRRTGAKPPRLIVHAGNRKTGSTAIQDYLLEYETGPGYEFLYRGKANSSLWMVQAFKQDMARYSFVPRGKSWREAITGGGKVDLQARVERIRAMARKALAKRVAAVRKPLGILSAENIYSMNKSEVEDLQDFLSALTPEIDVLVYIRSPKGQIESGFQERLKHGATALEKKYQLNHARRLQFFDSAFGRERVHVYKYARDSFPGGDVAAHFMRELGLEHQGGHARRANTALSLPATQLLYVYRKFYPDSDPIDRRVVAQLSGLPGERLRFHSSLYARIHSPDSDALRRFEERAGFSIDEDVTAYDEVGIRSEEDLLEIPGSALDWLRQKVGAMPAVDDEMLTVAESVRALGQLDAN